jgi:hypothetical protein
MKFGSLCALVLLALVFVHAGPLRAADEPAGGTKPIQIALWNPVQIFPEDTSILGVRLNLLYGLNRNMTGLDIGIGNHTKGDEKGLQYGLVGFVEGSFRGWQNNAFNYSETFYGFQHGFYNGAHTATGFELGFVNITQDMHGFQLGIFNMTQTLYGLQIGIINVVQQKEDLPILPIVNWSF